MGKMARCRYGSQVLLRVVSGIGALEGIGAGSEVEMRASSLEQQ